jgi:hypothetical protein
VVVLCFCAHVEIISTGTLGYMLLPNYRVPGQLLRGQADYFVMPAVSASLPLLVSMRPNINNAATLITMLVWNIAFPTNQLFPGSQATPTNSAQNVLISTQPGLYLFAVRVWCTQRCFA